MRKITFPHMGNLKIPAKAFFQELGFEVIVPPENSKKTLDLGVKYSPEFACLPLKINLGNFIEAMEEGANTIIMGGGYGPCRFGYYGEIQREILQQLDYDFEMFVIEPNLFEDLKNIYKFLGGFPVRKFINAGRLAWNKVVAVDEINKLVLKMRAREKKEGQVDKIYKSFLNKLDYTMSVDRINLLKREYTEMIEDHAGNYKRGVEINIGIVGEIYLVLEPFVNLDIEKKLGKLGASVTKEIYMTSWLTNFLHIENEMKIIEKAAQPYLKNFVGGHGIDTVGNTVRYSNKGYDGVIQVAPFTCMPEIVAQTILPEISKKEDIPVLSFFMDEHSGDAGFQTRLEAFVDLLVRKKINNREGVSVHG